MRYHSPEAPFLRLQECAISPLPHRYQHWKRRGDDWLGILEEIAEQHSHLEYNFLVLLQHDQHGNYPLIRNTIRVVRISSVHGAK